MNNNSDVMYRLLVQSVVDYAIYMLKPDGTVANWNSGAQRAKGYTPDEIVGKNFALFYSEDDRKNGAPQRGLATATATGRFETEGWRYRKDGSAFWAHVVIDAIRDEFGELLGFAKITRDCTEQQEQQRKQREQEQRFRMLVEGVSDYAIYMLDLDGNVENWNVGAQRAKGYVAEEIVGQHFSRFYSAQDRKNHIPEKNLTTAFKTGRFEDEGYRYRKDGSAFWAHVIIDAIRDDAGKLIGYAKITRDCTEQQALLRKQHEQEKNFRLLVEGVRDYAIYMLDVQGRVVNWNNGAQRAKGYLADEIVGQHFSVFYSSAERHANAPEANLGIALKTGRFEDEGWRYRKDGSAFWAHVVIEAIHDESGKLIGFAKITRDITERRENEQQLLRARDLAQSQSAKMSELSGFLDTIISNIPSCVIVEDAISREILMVNDKAEQLFGINKALIMHKRPHECMSAELGDYFNSLADVALRSEGIHSREQLLLTAGGERILHTRATTISGKDMR